jgi:hypothetical protein
MATKKKETPADKAFAEMIKLYDIADKLEDNNLGEEAEELREGLNKTGKFILSTKKK